MNNRKELEEVRRLADEFAAVEGRRPRILVANAGQPAHDHHVKVIAMAFADMGFDADVGPRFESPERIAAHATENDVHIISISGLGGRHNTFISQLTDALKNSGRPDIMVIAGDPVAEHDRELVRNAGAFIVTPDTALTKTATEILEALLNDM